MLKSWHFLVFAVLSFQEVLELLCVVSPHVWMLLLLMALPALLLMS